MRDGFHVTATLVQRRSGGAGLSADADGASLCSAIDLVWRDGRTFHALDARQVGELLRKGFGDDRNPSAIADVLAVIARSLARGDVAHAQILGMYLPFAALGTDGALAKTYNPNEPRVPAGSGRASGQWTKDSGASQGASATGATGGGELPPYAGRTRPDAPLIHPLAGRLAGRYAGVVSNPEVLPADVKDNKAIHDAVMNAEIAQWKAMGFVVTTQVSFINPKTGVRATCDYVVSMKVANPDTFFLTQTLEPILVRDIKTGDGGERDNQKDVYGQMRLGGEVIPIGEKAFEAGFSVGEPTIIREISVGDKYDFTQH